jgi:hypothetical protein
MISCIAVKRLSLDTIRLLRPPSESSFVCEVDKMTEQFDELVLEKVSAPTSCAVEMIGVVKVLEKVGIEGLDVVGKLVVAILLVEEVAGGEAFSFKTFDVDAETEGGAF